MGNQDSTGQRGTRESVRRDDTLDRTWLTWQQQEALGAGSGRIKSQIIYEREARARLELESLVISLVPPGRSQYLYNGGISRVDFVGVWGVWLLLA